MVLSVAHRDLDSQEGSQPCRKCPAEPAGGAQKRVPVKGQGSGGRQGAPPQESRKMVVADGQLGSKFKLK